MADYLHKLPADDPFWSKQANRTEEDLFWEKVDSVLRENEDKMNAIAKQRKIRRRLFKQNAN